MRFLKYTFTIILLSFIVMLSACGNSSGYETSAEWGGLSGYMFAVEVDDFDGDIFESGKYRVYVRGTKTKPEETVIVWDVYISDNFYTNRSELKDSEYVTTIGGNSNIEDVIDLRKGQYVYFNYNDVWGEPRGILCIEKQKD